MGQVKSETKSDRQNSASNRGTGSNRATGSNRGAERVVINLEATYNKTGNEGETSKNKPDSYRKLAAQCQKLTEENKRIQNLIDENTLLK